MTCHRPHLAKHFAEDTAPGIPADALSSAAHQARALQALDQILNGDKVSVDPMPDGASFIPRAGETERMTALAQELKVGAERIARELGAEWEGNSVGDLIRWQLQVTEKYTPQEIEAVAQLNDRVYSNLATRISQAVGKNITPEDVFKLMPNLIVQGERAGEGVLNALTGALPKGWTAGDGATAAAMWRGDHAASSVLLENINTQKLSSDVIGAENYSHSVSKSGLDHIGKNHGDVKTEASRGQIAITDKDIERIPEIIGNYDAIRTDLVNKQGRPVIAYAKKVDDGTLIYLETVGKKRRDMAALSLWKYRTTVDASTALTKAVTADPNVRNGEPHRSTKLNLTELDGEVKTRTGNYDQIDNKVFNETAKLYGGEEAYNRQKAAGKTNLDYKQWVQVRTPEFKSWFGDWESARLGNFLNGAPVATVVRGIAPRKGFAALREWATNLFESQGGKAVNDEIGEVILNGQAARDSIAHGMNDAKADAFASVKDVIERGRIVARNESKKSAESIYIAAPVRLGDVDNIVLVLVRRGKDNRMYLHGVETKENLQALRKSRSEESSGGRSVESLGGVSKILSDSLNVNPDTVSKAVDPTTGEPLVVYHGTPDASFDSFKPATGYMSANKGYADGYQEPSASSISYGKQKVNPGTYALFLNLKRPFDTRNTKEREIFLKEYYMKYGTGAPISERGLPDWTDGMDLQEFIEEKGYKYDGLILDEGGVGGYDEDVILRGESFVVFNPTNIKSATGNEGGFNPNSQNIYKQTKTLGGIKGSFDPSSFMTALTDAADFSTLIHENGHLLLEGYGRLADLIGGEFLEEQSRIFDWLGIKDRATWDAMDIEARKPYHEQFAKGFERYLAEGVAPTPELASVFAKIKEWMLSIYKAIESIGAEISPEIRGVFDRLMENSEVAGLRSGERRLAREFGVGEAGQPAEPPAKPRQPVNDLDAVYRLVEEARPEFNRFVEDLKQKYGGEILARKTLKSKDRAERKITAEEGADSILDIDAKSLVFDDIDAIPAILKDLQSRDDVVRIKNRFVNAPPSGYRDALVNVRLKNGAVVELQLHTRPMIEAKENGGHTLYEVAEQLGNAIKSGKLSRKYVPVYKAVLQTQKSIYDAAASASFRRANFSANSREISEQLYQISSLLQDSGAAMRVLSEKTRNGVKNLSAKGRSSHSTNTKSGSSNDGTGDVGDSGILDSSSRPILPRTPEGLQREIDQRFNPETPALYSGREMPSVEESFPVRGKTATAVTERGQRIDTQFVVTEADDLITSHDNALNQNPNYPQALQPRVNWARNGRATALAI